MSRIIGKIWINPIGFDPGAKYRYSGEGFEYLKTAIEKKTGKPIETLARELVFEPAGMNSTSFTWSDQAEDRVAVGKDRLGKTLPYPKRTSASAADDLLTTIGDYANFVAWVLSGARLPQDLFEELQRPQVSSESNPNFGLGWQILDVKQRILQHGGADQGVRTEAVLDFGRREAVVVFTSGDLGEIRSGHESFTAQPQAAKLTASLEDNAGPTLRAAQPLGRDH
jgi:CubicO group peptidase (beta-lactamase class C family)